MVFLQMNAVSLAGSKVTGLSELDPNWVWSTPNGTNLGLYMIAEPNALKLIFKSPRFVPFWANLTQFGTNTNIPDKRIGI